MILRLLRKQGVLDEAEYQAALAQSPNVGRLQQKVDATISTPPVFSSPSSSRLQTDDKPAEEQPDTAAEPAMTAPEDKPSELSPAKQAPAAEPLPEKQ
jgi:monofunctional biosynthetic peptidoglycan transglycosylase